jgi:Fe-S-cluster containining protein
MASCDSCRRPGQCCHGFALSVPDVPLEGWKVAAENEMEARGLYFFEPLHFLRRPTGLVTPIFKCARLIDGRCSKYDERPNVCRVYEPGQDQLCAEFVRTFAGIPVVTKTAA